MYDNRIRIICILDIPILVMFLLLIRRFYGRDTGLYKFQIHAGMLTKVNPQSQGRRLVAFTFHPNAPFAISVQRANAEYLVNFHLRLDENLLSRTASYSPNLISATPECNIPTLSALD